MNENNSNSPANQGLVSKKNITVFQAAWLGLSIARACGHIGRVSVHTAAAAGLDVHRRFREQGRRIRVVDVGVN